MRQEICERFIISLLIIIFIFSISEGRERARYSNNISIRSSSTLDEWWYESENDCFSELGAVDIVFVVDNSGSMETLILEVADEIERFAFNIAAIGYDYSFGLLTFCESINYPHGRDLIDDAAEFSAIVRDETATGGGTEHHTDAMVGAIRNMHWHTGRQHIVIVISDECDDGSTAYTVSAANSIIDDWDADDDTPPGDDGTIYYISGDCGDVADFQNYAERSDGIWYEFEGRDMEEVLEQIVDEIADFTEIAVSITNLSGLTLDLVVEIAPQSGIVLGDSANPRMVGIVTSGATVNVAWDITEIPGILGYEDCFLIFIHDADYEYADTIVGCLFVENCGCPGPDAEIICPEVSSRWTACDYQDIQISYLGFIGVDHTSICFNVEGTDYCYGDPGVTWDGSSIIFTPMSPWPDNAEINITVGEALDLSGCPIRFMPESYFLTDLDPPAIGWWEHHDASVIPPTPPWREWHDSIPVWSFPCGSTIDSTDHITFDALLFDSLSGLTPIDNFTSLSGLDLAGIWSGLTSIRATVNGANYIPGVIPGGLTRTVDFNLSYILSGHYVIGGWLVHFTGRADSLSMLGPSTGEIEVCIHAHDMVEGSDPAYEGCLDCVNDTQWCCTFLLPFAGPIVDAGPDLILCYGDSVQIGGSPTATEGTPPYSYSWSPTAGLNSSIIPNPLASPETTTTYVVTVTDDSGLTNNDFMVVEVTRTYADAGEGIEICPQDTVQLGGDPVAYGDNPPFTFTWRNNRVPVWISREEHPLVSPDTTTTYYLEVVDSIGCSATDSIIIANNFVPVNDFNPIVPDSGEILPAGDITIEWEHADGTPPIYYTLFIDDTLVAALIDSTHYTVTYPCGHRHLWRVEAVNFCGIESIDAFSDSFCFSDLDACFEVFHGLPGFSVDEIIDSCCINHPPVYTGFFPLPYDPPFQTEVCEGPAAIIIRPDSNTYSACQPETLIIELVDTSEVVDTTIRLEVQGVVYTVDDGQLTWSEPYIVFIPDEQWANGSHILVRLLEAKNRLGGALQESPVEWTFIVDIAPPVAELQEPLPGVGFVQSTQPRIVLGVNDLLSGVDASTITLIINGSSYTPADFHWSANLDEQGGVLTFLPAEAQLSFPPGDTIQICVNAGDSPDYCGPNMLDTCWTLLIEPVVECYVHPNPFSPNADGSNDYIIFDYPNVFSKKAELVIYDFRNIEVYRENIGPISSFSEFAKRKWDGNDNNGKKLPEGMYIYVIEIDNKNVCNGVIILAR
ncbi:gliding motility-associated C-terminal domain-containing protein [bacterium]|nr:gliding motility-associated C-terminal domain-containing protein [bacterium]